MGLFDAFVGGFGTFFGYMLLKPKAGRKQQKRHQRNRSALPAQLSDHSLHPIERAWRGSDHPARFWRG